MTELPSPSSPAERAEPVDLLDTDQAGAASIRGGAIRVGGYASGLLLSLLSAPLLIRHLGLGDFGRYSAAMAVVALCAGLTEFGLRDAALREYSTSSGLTRDEHMASTIGVRLVLSGLGIVVAGGFALAAGYDRTIVIGVLFAAAGYLFNTLQAILAVPLAVQLRLTTVTALDFAQQLINVILIIALVVAGAGIGGFLDVQLVVTLPTLLITAWLVRGTLPLRPRIAPAHWRRVIAATLPFTAISIVGVFYLRISIIFMSLESTRLQTGYFATSYRVISALIYVPAVLTASAFPILSRAARSDEARFSHAVRRMFDVSLVAGTAVALALAIGAPVVTDVLAGRSSGPIVTVLRIHAMVMPSAFLVALGGYALMSIHRQRAVLGSIATGLVVNGGLLAVLVPRDGAIGAAIAGSSGEAVIAMLMTGLIIRTTEVELALRPALAVLGACATAVAVAEISALVTLPALVATALALVVFAGLVALTGVLPRELLTAFRRR